MARTLAALAAIGLATASAQPYYWRYPLQDSSGHDIVDMSVRGPSASSRPAGCGREAGDSGGQPWRLG
jgi:hypothetical protein